MWAFSRQSMLCASVSTPYTCVALSRFVKSANFITASVIQAFVCHSRCAHVVMLGPPVSNVVKELVVFSTFWEKFRYVSSTSGILLAGSVKALGQVRLLSPAEGRGRVKGGEGGRALLISRNFPINHVSVCNISNNHFRMDHQYICHATFTNRCTSLEYRQLSPPSHQKLGYRKLWHLVLTCLISSRLSSPPFTASTITLAAFFTPSGLIFTAVARLEMNFPAWRGLNTRAAAMPVLTSLPLPCRGSVAGG